MSKVRYKITTTIIQPFGDGYDNVTKSIDFVTGSKAKDELIKNKIDGVKFHYGIRAIIEGMIDIKVESLANKGGFVYVLTNESMPGIVKIGRTSKEPNKRMDELYTTGVPTPFELAYSVQVSNAKAVENEMHRLFGKVRIAGNREFFKVSAKKVVAQLKGMV